ncbi:MAG: serine hydroxymethyltransferase, partial [Mesorhizobium sp.]
MDNSAGGAIAQPDTYGRPHLAAVDSRVHELLLRQERQERTTLKLIASENFA